jgi:primary-amine oxidase
VADHPATAHPLDPLGKEEIVAAVQALKSAGKLTDGMRFPIITLHEPPKAEVLGLQPGASMRREAFAVLMDRAANRTYEAVVDIANRHVLSWKLVPGVQPAILMEEFSLTQEIVRADPGWREAMRKRGIKDFENVQIEPWSAGYYGFPQEEGMRVARAVSCYRGTSKNPYARPIEGVIAYVDLNRRKVFKLVDSGVVPVPKAAAYLDEASIGELRQAPKPLRIVQPEGVGFEIRGNEIRWQNWRFRIALHPREGLVLYTVGYEDHGKLRSVLYRASLSEMFVPYGDPGPGWFFRNVFDEGEYGLGRLTNSLDPRGDYPANAVLLNATFADDGGTPFEIPRAIAVFERDGGVLWKHVDYVTKHNESRRARELVVSAIATVGNYEYGFNWVFHQDGALEMELILTGIMAAKAVDAAGHPGGRHGHLVARDVEAVHHQHFFNFRLDLDIDGPAGNSVLEMNTEPLPAGPGNPYQGAFVMNDTLLRREQDARRSLNLASNRKWKIINSAMKNDLGEPAGYILQPGENSVPYADPESSMRRRAGFLNAHFWATAYDPDQMNAAGYYINQSKGGEGLPAWIRGNRDLENADVVVWYTMGITHIPRAEEWPVMPVHRTGFKLIPCGFFARNPALDVPNIR